MANGPNTNLCALRTYTPHTVPLHVDIQRTVRNTKRHSERWNGWPTTCWLRWQRSHRLLQRLSFRIKSARKRDCHWLAMCQIISNLYGIRRCSISSNVIHSTLSIYCRARWRNWEYGPLSGINTFDPSGGLTVLLRWRTDSKFCAISWTGTRGTRYIISLMDICCGRRRQRNCGWLTMSFQRLVCSSFFYLWICREWAHIRFRSIFLYFVTPCNLCSEIVFNESLWFIRYRQEGTVNDYLLEIIEGGLCRFEKLVPESTACVEIEILGMESGWSAESGSRVSTVQNGNGI